MADKIPLKWVCCQCGSDEIRATVQARWDIAAQEWVIVPNSVSEPDQDYCVRCGEDTGSEEVTLDFRDKARIAIERNKEETN